MILNEENILHLPGYSARPKMNVFVIITVARVKTFCMSVSKMCTENDYIPYMKCMNDHNTVVTDLS